MNSRRLLCLLFTETVSYAGTVLDKEERVTLQYFICKSVAENNHAWNDGPYAVKFPQPSSSCSYSGSRWFFHFVEI